MADESVASELFVDVPEFEQIVLWSKESVETLLKTLLSEDRRAMKPKEGFLQPPTPQLLMSTSAAQHMRIVTLRVITDSTAAGHLRPIDTTTSTEFVNAVKNGIRKPGFARSDAWRTNAESELRRHLGMHDIYALPAHLWSLLEIRAWANADYLLSTTTLVEDFLLQRAFMQVNGFRVMTLTPRLGWLLLGIAFSPLYINPPISSVSRPARLLERLLAWLRTLRLTKQTSNEPSSFGPIEQTAMERVVMEAQALGLQTGWATVWDQFVLLEAALCWDAAMWLPSIRAAVAALPLRAYYLPHPGLDRLDGSKNSPSSFGVEIARKDWNTDVPPWFFTWLKSEKRA